MANKVQTGKVIKAHGNKSIVVEVQFSKLHTLYKKYVKVSKKYHVHDENNTCKVGDVVNFISCAPISKTKSWKVCEA